MKPESNARAAEWPTSDVFALAPFARTARFYFKRAHTGA